MFCRKINVDDYIIKLEKENNDMKKEISRIKKCIRDYKETQNYTSIVFYVGLAAGLYFAFVGIYDTVVTSIGLSISILGATGIYEIRKDRRFGKSIVNEFKAKLHKYKKEDDRVDNEIDLKIFFFAEMVFNYGVRSGYVIAENEENAKSIIIKDISCTPLSWGPVESEQFNKDGVFIR